jgi:hypothetical protein
MPNLYRFYRLAHDGRIAGPPKEIEYESDSVAIGSAFALFKDAVAVEVWSGARRVAHLTAQEVRIAKRRRLVRIRPQPISKPSRPLFSQKAAENRNEATAVIVAVDLLDAPFLGLGLRVVEYEYLAHLVALPRSQPKPKIVRFCQPGLGWLPANRGALLVSRGRLSPTWAGLRRPALPFHPPHKPSPQLVRRVGACVAIIGLWISDARQRRCPALRRIGDA